MERVAILDCGGQYTKVIDRKVRELGVKSEIYPIGIDEKTLQDCSAIILSGGPASVYEDNSFRFQTDIFKLGVPILGICYGMQLIIDHFGGVVSPKVKKEYGETDITVDLNCEIFKGLNSENQTVLMSHGDSVDKLAEGFNICAKSGELIVAISNENEKIYGVQFHPEVDLSVNGKQMLKNFLTRICNLSCDYRLEDRINSSIAKIKSTVGDENVIVMVSGGVDSAVTAALLLKALDHDKVFAIHVDHGLMRKDESDIICENLKKLGLKHLNRLNVQEQFFNRKSEYESRTIGPLTELVDPEEKRNLVGNLFIHVVKDATEEMGLDFEKTFWAQGTLRPDLIESGNPDVSSYAHKIKTHHNDVDLIRKAREKGLIIETNWDWHKDEVRQVAIMLGIEEEVAYRQPFPGPGLSVRIICNDLSEKVLDHELVALNNFVKDNHVKKSVNIQVAPIRTVGVQGDCRSYKHLAIVSKDSTDEDNEYIYQLGRLMPNQLDFVNRVALVLNKEKIEKPIQCYEMRINQENADLLREVDSIVTKNILAENKNLGMVFAVLVPIGIEKNMSVAIRTIITNDYMTGRPGIIGKDISEELIDRITSEIKEKFSQIDLVLYDVTAKPPATIEWQ